jgi:hypothetical protein
LQLLQSIGQVQGESAHFKKKLPESPRFPELLVSDVTAPRRANRFGGVAGGVARQL